MIKKNYQFHFLISETMTKYISYLKKELRFKKDIELYDYMLEIMSKNLPKFKGIIGDHKSEYALIDSIGIPRVNKYARLKENSYKKLKKWHYDFNEYGMAAILRDIIKFFFEGVVKYGVDRFIEMISKKLDVKRIGDDARDILTHLIGICVQKAVLFSFIAQNLSFYT